MGTTKKASKQGAPSGLAAILFRPPVLILVALGVTSTFLLPMARQWGPDLSQRPEYLLKATEIETSPPPPWVPPDFVRQAVRRGALPETLSVLDADLTRRVAEAFRMHPWVAKVVSVRKAFPARVFVEVRFREPVAMVRVRNGVYPIDGQGVLLPPEDFTVAETRQYPLIENIVSTPQGAAGTPWGDPVVHGAARLAAVLKPVWHQFGLKSIRAPRRTKAQPKMKSLVYQLVTSGGSRIIWGRAPGVDYPGELSPKQKVGRMAKYLTVFGGFDQPHGPYEIDIRHWQEISRRPLTSARQRWLR
ncbi:MAG TPA: hypothetical protein EYP14_13805 [Planctomycetaceae bacterium]|nr:hypothetical protein [Planctomycetaceae bacterium]